ncbi:MAG TPA: hypothetical protein VKI20_11635, partial [Acidimicrobiales bacterium]|nr:hypothetical protein [Acidimicrobiales bacterium]
MDHGARMWWAVVVVGVLTRALLLAPPGVGGGGLGAARAASVAGAAGGDLAITTVAGDGEVAFAGDGGPAAQAQFSTLIQIALDAAGRQLYIADIGNRRIRR